jgi:ribosomal protein L11 methyltransferase
LLEPLPGETPLWEGEVKVVGLFEAQTNLRKIKQALTTLCSEENIAVSTLDDQDWTRTWLDHFQPISFGQRLWVCPTHHTIEVPPEAAVLKLDPGLAFGTGTHPTTALCLRWLDANPPLDEEVIDYGSGSGILGIAALLLGAKKVWAVDYDPQALVSTRENALRNDLTAEQIITVLPNDFGPIQAKTILANILAEPLIELAPKLAEHALPGAKLILSGLLLSQADRVKEAYAPFFKFEDMQTEEGWVLLAFSFV